MLKHVAAAVFFYVLTACAAGSDPQFHIAGHVGGPVTHVVATTPSHIAVQSVVTRVSGDGNFVVDLEPGYAWTVTFVDATHVGAAMVQGTLQSGELDAFAPRGGGVLDLGDVTIANGRAHGTASTSWVNDTLGIDAALAAKLGAADDLATRYSNPDVDNDGVLDALQPDRNFRLDLWGKLDLTIGGAPATMDTLVRGDMMTGLVGVHYRETGIVVALPEAYAHEMTDATMTFGGDFYGTSLGDATPMIAAGATVAQPELKLGAVDAQPTLGAFARTGHDVPGGEYTVSVGAHVLTFSDVRPVADAQLAVAHNLVMPFMQIMPTEADCVTDCQIASFRTMWKRGGAGGWVDVADGEMQHGAHLEIVRSHAGVMQTLGIDLPAQPSTDIAWSSMPSITTGELCYVAMTYDDGVGMRITSQITNPACY